MLVLGDKKPCPHPFGKSGYLAVGYLQATFEVLKDKIIKRKLIYDLEIRQVAN